MLGPFKVYRAETLAKFLNIAARTPLLERVRRRRRRRRMKRSELLVGVRQDGYSSATARSL
jgi:hypothetical protein